MFFVVETMYENGGNVPEVFKVPTSWLEIKNNQAYVCNPTSKKAGVSGRYENHVRKFIAKQINISEIRAKFNIGSYKCKILKKNISKYLIFLQRKKPHNVSRVIFIDYKEACEKEKKYVHHNVTELEKSPQQKISTEDYNFIIKR